MFEGADDDAKLQSLQDRLAATFNAKTNEGATLCDASETQDLIDLASSAFAQKARSLVLLGQD